LAAATTTPLPVRVMIVSMFGPERQVWRERRKLGRSIRVPGLSGEYPEVHCDAVRDFLAAAEVWPGHK
jgi:purine nucleoside permease